MTKRASQLFCALLAAVFATFVLGADSRQNIDDLMKRDKLHPIRKDTKYKLFLRNEVLQRRRT